MAIYNLFNAGNVISMNTTYGAGWREAAVLPPLPITSRTSLSA